MKVSLDYQYTMLKENNIDISCIVMSDPASTNVMPLHTEVSICIRHACAAVTKFKLSHS